MKERCGKCIYRAAKFEVYQCDYASITGKTRKAVPAERCRHFRPGDPVESPAKTVHLKNSKTFRQRRPRRAVYDWGRGRKLYDAGTPDSGIAKELGCSAGAVQDWRRRNGLPGIRNRKRKQEGEKC